MKTMKVSEARKLFARVLESVVKDGELVVIVRYREPIAAIVPMSHVAGLERSLKKTHKRNRQQQRE
jgi:antitoxin (DNA-binding transcriptional repressor) of toxin-antitoxin stability system